MQIPTIEELMQQLRAQYPAPGELVDVNGTRMHIRCEGTGSPTVVMEAGSGDCSLSWALVQQNVSAFTRVCTYDRQGYAWSDPVSGPLTASNVTGRLHTLLSRANVSPPYVLAGHSLGGVYVRYYTHRYPDEVAGMVLVDPGSEWQMIRTGVNFTREQKAAISLKTSLLRGMGKEAANGTFVKNLSLLQNYCNPKLPAYEYHAFQALWATNPSFWDACAVEGESGFSIWEEVSRENITSLGTIPLIVISSGLDMGFSTDPDENKYANTVFRTLQKEMASESLQGKYLIATNSSHYIQIDEPDLVTGAIRSVVNATRQDSPIQVQA
jgi:pimeloyl-ACP methyl ester carboxylesterase